MSEQQRSEFDQIVLKVYDRVVTSPWGNMKRSDMAINCIIGAAFAAEATGNEPLVHQLKQLALLISIRGYSELVDYHLTLKTDAVP